MWILHQEAYAACAGDDVYEDAIDVWYEGDGSFSAYPHNSFDTGITIWVCHVLINKCRGPLLLNQNPISWQHSGCILASDVG